tara:strand:- start:178 stop:360 length:183 start_codon:yes stop_codon:yes gene_type:complete
VCIGIFSANFHNFIYHHFNILLEKIEINLMAKKYITFYDKFIRQSKTLSDGRVGKGVYTV